MSAVTEHLNPLDGRALPAADFAATAGLTENEVRELEGFHLIGPSEHDMQMALALREATRLRADFDLDLFTTGLLAHYIRRTRILESELQHERARAPGAVAYTEVSFTSVEVIRRG